MNIYQTITVDELEIEESIPPCTFCVKKNDCNNFKEKNSFECVTEETNTVVIRIEERRND